MLSIPAALWPHLLSQGFRPVEVYEIEAFAGRSILRYSSQDITWGGNAYTGLAIKRGSIRQTMEFSIPDVTLTFTNAANTLRSYLSPTDTLTGARLTVRLVMRDSGGSVMTDSVVLFRGRIEPPRQISEQVFELSAVGLLDAVGVEAPSRRMSLNCQWQFANLGAFDGNGHCSYIYSGKANGAGTGATTLNLASTTANGAGASSTALTLTAASQFKNGDLIKIGTNDPVTIVSGAGTTSIVLRSAKTWSNLDAVVPYFATGDSIQIGGGSAVTITAGGGTSALTLATARTWANLDMVRYAECPNHSRSECEARGMLHRFGGHPGVAGTARIIRKKYYTRNLFPQGPPQSTQHGRPPIEIYQAPIAFTGKAGEAYADTSAPVPVLYGRRRFSPKIVETVGTQSPVRVKIQQTTFYSVSIGEIDSIVRYYLQDKLGVDSSDGGDKRLGIYYRAGTVGVVDDETIAEYTASPTTQVRSQNIDYRSFALIAYSEEAYAILVQDNDLKKDETTFSVDAKGRKVQKYDAAGATSGARTWSESPIWQAVDWITSDFGLNLVASDIDFAVTKPEADHGEVLITGTEAATTVTLAAGSATTTCWVKSTEGLICGRRVDVAGVANTVASIQTDTKFTLGSAVTQAVGDTVVQRPQRFESHLLISDVDRGTRWLQALLAACRGYVTYDNAKVQLRIERATCSERLTDGGFETWSSATNLTNWVEAISAGNTVNRETTGVHGGTYCVRMDRTATGTLSISQDAATREPGRWYREALWFKGSSSISTGFAVEIFNTTTSKYLQSDRISWSAGAYRHASDVTAAWQQFELTWLNDPAAAASDTISVRIVHNNTGSTASLYVDDASERGPYAGDFRETTTANVMGWKEGSFRWSVDRKDRETNRVVVKFVNESGYFGDDEAVANDFTHQQIHTVKTISKDVPAICDRDQAMREAKRYLAKARTLGTGCEFVASPAGLALQPGDVILVSHTVPGWTCKEQRVVEMETFGMPGEDEHFTAVKTEDYLESIYQDGGAVQFTFPPVATSVLTVAVLRNGGGILDLSMTLSDATYSVRSYEVHMSATSGFTPDASTLIGTAATSRFTYTAQIDELDVLRYFVVIALTDREDLTSAEFSTTIFRNETTTSGYSGNYKYPTALQSVDPAVGVNAYVNEVAGTATVAKVDATAGDSTYLTGHSHDGSLAGAYDSSIRYHSFTGGGSGKTGRPYVRGKRVTSGAVGDSSVKYYYTMDRTAGTPTWVLWQTVTSATIADYFGPELTGVDYTKFAIRCRTVSNNASAIGRTIDDYNHTVAFDEKA